MTDTITIKLLDENNASTMLTVPCRARRGPFAVAEIVRDGARYYTVTHLKTGLKAHPFVFGDLLAATECAEAFAAAFPGAAEWHSKNTQYRSESLAIWEQHMSRDAYNREVESHEEHP